MLEYLYCALYILFFFLVYYSTMLLWSAGVNPLGAFIFTAFLKALPPPSLFPLGGKGKEEGGPLKRGEAEITQGVYPRCPIFPRKRLGVA